jgi:lipoyl-dependent peroxiredoxin
MILEKVQYTARIHTTGGRDGAAHSDDGRLAVKLSAPGTSGTGTNPEQLFAAGWSACFIGAITSSELGSTSALPGLEHEIAQSLVDAAHQTCPYSKATRGNIDVAINLL